MPEATGGLARRPGPRAWLGRLRAQWPRWSPALLMGAVLIVNSCGPDRRGEGLGPNADKIDEPLSANATHLTMAGTGGTAAQACSLPLDLLVNAGNLSRTASGYKVNGSIFANTGAYGPQRFANGAFTLTTDPNDPSRILDITGDGAAVLPFVGALKDFLPSTAGIRASFGVRRGSELQDLDVPVPGDNRCYFLIQILPTSEGFTAAGASFSFSMGLDAKIVLDPSDPLFYFTGSLSTVPGMPNPVPIEDAALGFSAQGRLESTAKAIPNKIISGHLFLGATFEIPDTPFTVSGNIFLRFPDLNSSNPEIVFSLDGSLFLSGNIVSDIFGGVIPGLDNALHLGDGTVIQEIGIQTINGVFIPLPHFHTEMGLQTADIVGNMVSTAHLGDAIQAKTVASVSGYIDTGPIGFRVEIGADIGLNFPILQSAGLDLHMHFLVSTTGEFDWSVGGTLDLGPLHFLASMRIDAGGFDFLVSANFNIDIPPQPFQVIYVGLGATLEIGYPTPGAKVSMTAYACFADPFSDPDPCLTFVGTFSTSGWCIGGTVGLNNWSIDGDGGHQYLCSTAFEPADYVRTLAAAETPRGTDDRSPAVPPITIPYRAGAGPS